METKIFRTIFFRFLLPAIVVLGILFSCSRSQNTLATPDPLLSQKEMISIMTDVHLMEAALNIKRNQGLSTNELKEAWYEQLFEKHGINVVIFEENLSFYNEQPAEMEMILEEVMANLSQIQSEINLEKSDETGEKSAD